MKHLQLIPVGLLWFSMLGCTPQNETIDGSYRVTVTWVSGEDRGSIYEHTYFIRGDTDSASDIAGEFSLGRFTDNSQPSSYALNKVLNTTVNGVELSVGPVSGTREPGIEFPFIRLLSFYQGVGKPEVAVFLSIDEGE